MKKALAALLCILFSSCAAGAPRKPKAAPAPTPALLIDARGVVMPAAQARSKIAFKPVVPANALAVAAVPPLAGPDGIATHGFAVEYQSGADRFLLTQWPRNGLNVAVGSFNAAHRPCAPVAYKADGLLWATRNGLVMTLQPDGAVSGSRLASESRRLTATYGCSKS